MRKLMMMLAVAGLVATVGCDTLEINDENEGQDEGSVRMNFNQLPLAVQTAALKFFNVTNIKEVERKGESDTPRYGVEGIANGKKTDLVFAADGVLIKKTVKVEFASLPKLAQKAILKDYPNGKVKEVEKVMETSYKVEILVNAEKREIEVKASGDIEDENDGDQAEENKDEADDSERSENDDDNEGDDD
ncbi:MAG: hypothetical protein GXP32_10445 [Kiritimatiellaeota bacterium]|nr:hypothetical protein [Kiritimatiellota bacterium]